MSDKFNIINQLSILTVISALGLPLAGQTQGKIKIRVKCFQCSKPNSTPDLEIDTNANKLKCYSANCAFNVQNRNNFRVSNFDLAKEYKGKETIAWFDEHFPDIKNGNYDKIKKHNPKLSYPIKESPKVYKDFDDVYNFIINFLPDITEKNYLIKERLLSIDIVKSQQIKAYDESLRFKLVNELRKNYSDQKLVESGVLKPSKNNNLYFFLWFSPYVVPIRQNNKIITLQGRSLDTSNSKYKFLPGRPTPEIYIPNQPESDYFFLCEGVITSLTYLKLERPSVALISGNVKPEYLVKELEPIKDKHFILAPDSNDKTEMKAVRDVLRQNGISVDLKPHKVINEAHSKGFKPNEIYNPKTNKYLIKDLNDLLQFEKKRLD
mgnify:CR=1 FL=1